MNFEESMQQKMEAMYKNNGSMPRAQNVLGTPKQSIRQLGRSSNTVRKVGMYKK